MEKSDSISPPPTKRARLKGEMEGSRHLQSPHSAPSTTPAPKHDSDTALRIFSWNINGIAPFIEPPQSKPITMYFSQTPKSTTSITSQSPTPPSLRAFLHRHSYPDILFLQEVKINPSDKTTCDKLQAHLNNPLNIEGPNPPTYAAHFTLPRDKHNARGFGGKVYGVASIIRNDIARSHSIRTRTVDWDLEGRVNIVELPCSHLALFNIYAVNGTASPYKNSATGEVQGTRHDRKRAFHRLMMAECVGYERRGWSVILGGDMNVAPARVDGFPNLRTFPHEHVVNRADFNARFLGVGKLTAASDVGEGLEDGSVFNGVDVWRAMRGPEEKGYTYYPRGKGWATSCDRVDYFIVSKELYEQSRVIEAEIHANPLDRGTSDHVPISLAVRSEKGLAKNEHHIED